MKFAELCKYFEKIEKTESRNEMMEILAELLGKTGKGEVTQVVNLSLGQLRPKFDRLEFNLAEKMVIRIVSGVGERKIEDVAAQYKDLGDLGEVVSEMREGSSSKGISVGEVFEGLVEVAEDSGTGSQERKVAGSIDLLRRMNADEAKYVVRIIIGKLRLGFSDKTVLDALSYMEKGNKEGRKLLDEAYQVAPDVGELARLVKERGVEGARKSVSVKLGRPVMPALAQRLRSADEMIAKMGEVEVEPKYDGTRVQIHFSRVKRDEKKSEVKQDGLFGEEKSKYWVRTFTRNLDESSAMFPELADIGEQIRGEEVILDSEAVGIDPKTGKMMPFQMTITRKRKHGVKQAVSEVPLKFFVFDVLFKDGKSLVDKPLSERREVLAKTVKGEKVLVVDERIVTGEADELRRFHKKQLEAGLEGALVKKIGGKYLPGRQDWNWVKFKEEEGKKGKMADTVDAVIMGYYMGRGKRQKFGLGALLAGIREDGNIVTVAKIGTGISDEQFGELYARLKKIGAKEWDKSYKVEKSLVPDEWVKPEIVIEVAADEVTKSPTHSSGYALRFPRMVRFRDDKDTSEATSLVELKEIAGF